MALYHPLFGNGCMSCLMNHVIDAHEDGRGTSLGYTITDTAVGVSTWVANIILRAER